MLFGCEELTVPSTAYSLFIYGLFIDSAIERGFLN